MVSLSLTKLAAAVGGVAFALTAGSGIASADPMQSDHQHDLQLRAGYGRAQRDGPGGCRAAERIAARAGYVQQFLASPPPRRAQIAAQVQAMPSAAPYFNDIVSVATTCNNY